ncbi:MAG: acyl-CoA dehydrogenase [Actinomycetota bacterium]|nr:MAG: acyl-CoA dehydrogenase [Actinomycetota bacterium]
MESTFFDPIHEEFRASVREFIKREVAPNMAAWEEDGHIDPHVWPIAGAQGLIGLAVPEQYGGAGVNDYRFRCVVSEELAKQGAASVNAAMGLVDDLVLPYLMDLATPEQKERWLPGLASGRITGAIAMTEPGAGSDLRGITTSAVRDGASWRLNGSKTFITNGSYADILIVVARTNPSGGSHGFTLFVVERGMPGFQPGKSLDKLGQRAENVAELFFDEVEVPDENLLGDEGNALAHLRGHLPLERMSIAYYGLAAAEAAFDWTLAYVKERKAFGQHLAEFQNTKFALAEMSTEIDVTRSFINQAVLSLNKGELSAVDAAKAKWWATELQQRVINRCLQLHGGYGYMREYPIAKAFVDARVQTIYGGTTEIMKEIIGRDLIK